jgi:predicted Zn finger-like uncharacterized protein
MDVRCDRCQTEYELDETRLTEAGVAVKCTNCGNVFKVRMRASSLPNTLPNHLVGSPPSLGPPPALGGPHRSWLVRRYDGSTLSLNDLTELQRAVIERQVAPDDGVSISGGAWHTLGSIPELASFFEVVRAARTRTGPSAGVAADAGPVPGRSLTPVWQDGPSALGSVGAHGAEPAWVSRSALPDPEVAAMLEKEDKQVLRKSRLSAWVGGVVVVLLVVGVIAVYTVGIPGMSAPGTVAVAPIKPPDVNAMARTAPTPPADEAHAAGAPAPAVAPAPPGMPPKTEPPKAEPAPKEPKPAQTANSKKPEAVQGEEGGDTAPAGRSFDYYIGQGHKLLDSKPSAALAMFEKAAGLDPKSPEPDSGRGLAYANMEKLKDAAGAFQAALGKSSEFTEALLGLAEVSARQGNRRKAIGLYQRYLDVSPDGPDAPAARAQLDELKAEAPAPAPAPASVAAQAAPSPPPAPTPKAATETAAPARADLPPPPVVVPDTAPTAQ